MVGLGLVVYLSAQGESLEHYISGTIVGPRTADLVEDGAQPMGTSAIGEAIIGAIE